MKYQFDFEKMTIQDSVTLSKPVTMNNPEQFSLIIEILDRLCTNADIYMLPAPELDKVVENFIEQGMAFHRPNLDVYEDFFKGRNGGEEEE